ncbi:hypothetical protein C8Q75DRAFT_727307 [Abortiporus biennis]|nr:hypothetical protein C8Q75DRAFT_727307 [Abortiporus biennis]
MFPSLRALASALPEAAAAARTASTPRAVRLRRLRKRPAVQPGETDATPEGVTPTEVDHYQRQLATGDLLERYGEDISEKEWLDRLNERRSRIRGVREITNHAGEKESVVVGQKVYLPNIVFRLVRNYTPPGQPYNPYEATFRIPQSVTKTDVRSYLWSVYGVKTTYIRTDNYLSPIPAPHRTKQVFKTYKRAVVGLVDPFYYPLNMDTMSGEEKEQRQTWFEENFRLNDRDEKRKHAFLKTSRAPSDGFKWRGPATVKRSNILKRIAEQRAAREEYLAETKEAIQKARVQDVAESAQ